MERSPLFRLTIFLYVIFGVSTAGLIFIMIKNIDSPLAFKFVIGYLIFLLVFFIYLVTITVMGMRKLKRYNIRKRLVKFLLWFIGLGAATYIFNFIFHRPYQGPIEVLDVPLGMALGLAFMDLLFFKDDEE